jgi:hypothetical protein
MAEDLGAIAAMFGTILTDRPMSGEGAVQSFPASEVDLARRTLKARRRREELLGREFGLDLPWYVLLDLYVAAAEGRRVSVTAASLAAGGAPSSGLRMVSRMVEAGLLNRSPDSCDGRRSWVTLSSRSLDTVHRLLDSEPGAPVQPRL